MAHKSLYTLLPQSRNPISFVSVLSHPQLYSIPNPRSPPPPRLVTCDKYSSPQKFHIAGLFPIGFQIIVLAESHSIVCGGENHVYCTCYLTVRCGHKVGDKPNQFIILVYNMMILTAIR